MNELIQIGPISPLRQRLIDDMTMRRFSKETQRNYLRDVGRFATWLGRSPHTASAEDRYALEMTFSRGLFTGWMHGVDHQRLVGARHGQRREQQCGGDSCAHDQAISTW